MKLMKAAILLLAMIVSSGSQSMADVGFNILAAYCKKDDRFGQHLSSTPNLQSNNRSDGAAAFSYLANSLTFIALQGFKIDIILGAPDQSEAVKLSWFGDHIDKEQKSGFVLHVHPKMDFGDVYYSARRESYIALVFAQHIRTRELTDESSWEAFLIYYKSAYKKAVIGCVSDMNDALKEWMVVRDIKLNSKEWEREYALASNDKPIELDPIVSARAGKLYRELVHKVEGRADNSTPNDE